LGIFFEMCLKKIPAEAWASAGIRITERKPLLVD